MLESLVKGHGLLGGGGHYLSKWCWEPNFKPSTANVTSVAIKDHFLELPIKYY